MMKTGIKNAAIEGFLQENIAWERAFDAHLQENAFLKTRLSQVVDLNNDNSFIAFAERLQTSFIDMDDCIKDLKKDIIDSQKMLRSSNGQQYLNEDKLVKKHQKMRNEIGYFEKNFMALKDEFNQYIIQSMVS